MKNEKAYLNAELKVSDLVPGSIFLLITFPRCSTRDGNQFYDFVNAYRVEAAKRRLKDKNYHHYSILAIGLECGFTNKTTFNRTF